MHRDEWSMTANSVASLWFENFPDEVASSEANLIAQAVYFFRIAEGSGLGIFTLGRKGMPTRIDFDPDSVRGFLHGQVVDPRPESGPEESPRAGEESEVDKYQARSDPTDAEEPGSVGNRVFVDLGEDEELKEQILQIIKFGSYEPVFGPPKQSGESLPLTKTVEVLRQSDAGVILVTDLELPASSESEGKFEVNPGREQALLKIGSAVALLGKRLLLIVQGESPLPECLEQIAQHRYRGGKLDADGMMAILGALSAL